MKKLAVLISNAGSGTNLQAIIDAIENKKLQAKIVVVISDTKDAKGLMRAKKHKIPTMICQKKDDLIKILHPFPDNNITIQQCNNSYFVDYICFAGWKQFITDSCIDQFPKKILNLHPGLIPDTITGTVKNPDGTIALWNKGKLTDIAIAEFLRNNASYAGSSIHFLTHEFDFGTVLSRCFEKIKSNDTIETLYSRLKAKENKLYVTVLKKLCNNPDIEL